MQPVVYIVDDDPVQLALLTAQLERFRRFSTQGFTSPEDALEAVETEPPDGIVCDLVMPGMDGVEFTRFAWVFLEPPSGPSDPVVARFVEIVRVLQLVE